VSANRPVYDGAWLVAELACSSRC